MDIKELNQELGNADLLLIDQILKNRFDKDMSILDAGCGEGRNMTYFLNNNYNIFGLDQDLNSIRMARMVARSLNKNYNSENIVCSSIEENNFPDNHFDAVFCINVLPFSRNEETFFNVVHHLSRIVKMNGLLFITMETNIGMNEEIKRLKNGQYELPGGEIRFLLTERILEKMKREFRLVDIEDPRILIIGKDKRYMYFILSRETY